MYCILHEKYVLVPGIICIQSNTYQAIAVTDGSQSYAVYTYRCGYLEWSGGATIGYNGGPVGNFYANHPLSGSSANTIACLNSGETEWSNVVYNISCDACIPTEPPPTVEPRKASQKHPKVKVAINAFSLYSTRRLFGIFGKNK